MAVTIFSTWQVSLHWLLVSLMIFKPAVHLMDVPLKAVSFLSVAVFKISYLFLCSSAFLKSRIDFYFIDICYLYRRKTFSIIQDISSFFLFYKFIHLFIYFWLLWVFVAVHGLSLAAASRGFSCCRAQALGTRASVAVARNLSSCGSWALKCRLSSCGTWA